VQDASLRSRGTRSDIAHEQGHLGQARRPGWFSNFFFDLGSLGTLEPKGAQGGLEEADRNNRLGSYQGNRTSVSDSFGLNFHSTPTSSFQFSILRTIPDGGSLSRYSIPPAHSYALAFESCITGLTRYKAPIRRIIRFSFTDTSTTAPDTRAYTRHLFATQTPFGAITFLM